MLKITGARPSFIEVDILVMPGVTQGCINRSILPSGMGALGVSSEHMENMENAEKMGNMENMENMEMFSGSPLRCSPVLQLM